MVLVWCRACGPLLRSVESDDLELQLERYSSVSGMGKKTAVEYEEEARFFPTRDFKDSFDSRHVLHLSKDGRWTLAPNVDVYPEMLLVPSATGSVWLDGRNTPNLTTMMVAGHRLVRVYGFGAQRRIFSPRVVVWEVFVALETEVTCEEGKTPGLPEGSTPLATPVTSPGRRFDERETLDW